MGESISLSIGITTYKYRFDKYLKPLINQIRKQTQNEIILAVNGEYKEPFDNEYRKQLLNFCAETSNVYPFLYPNFRSLSKMWNNIIVNATSEYVLILNDDMIITDENYIKTVIQEIEKFQCNFRMGGHYSRFVIKKDTLLPSQYFDERFLGIGAEDWEYNRRIRRGICNMKVSKYGGILNKSDGENSVRNQRRNNKFSRFNLEVYNKNLLPADQYPFEDFYLKNHHKL
jgi:glycosyltransferase involved in cell wall biosynthesis